MSPLDPQLEYNKPHTFQKPSRPDPDGFKIINIGPKSVHFGRQKTPFIRTLKEAVKHVLTMRSDQFTRRVLFANIYHTMLIWCAGQSEFLDTFDGRWHDYAGKGQARHGNHIRLQKGYDYAFRKALLAGAYDAILCGYFPLSAIAADTISIDIRLLLATDDPALADITEAVIVDLYQTIDQRRCATMTWCPGSVEKMQELALEAGPGMKRPGAESYGLNQAAP